MLALYNELCKCQGAQWMKADLHVHTPASHDFRWEGINKDDFTEHKYVEAMLNTGLDMVAITDHSSAMWIDRMKQAARDLKRRHRKRLIVLPGAEIAVGGIHLLIIFSEDHNQEHVDDVLSKLEIRPKDRGRKNTICSLGIEKVIEIGHDHGGLVVGAHCLSKKAGILGAINGQQRLRALRELDALEIKPWQNIENARARAKECGWPDGPFLVSTDAHSPHKLRSDVSCIKVGSPCFRSLSQIQFEPHQRISYTGSPPVSHPRIIGLQASQGIYEDVAFKFSPHLNVLIGGRGAGKSAALDLIRFAFDLIPRRPENVLEFGQRLSSFLGHGGTVNVFIHDGDDRVLCVTRIGDYTKTKNRGKEEISFTYQPTLYELIDGRYIEINQVAAEQFPLEFYAQSEVLELSRKADDQLRLIDEHVNFGDLPTAEKQLLESLKTNCSLISSLEDRCEDLSQKVTGKQELRNRIDYLRGQLDNPIFATREQWQRERELLEWSDATLKQFSQTIQDQKMLPATAAPSLGPGTPNEGITNKALAIIERAGQKLREANKLAKAALIEAEQELQALRTRWEELDHTAEQEFQNKLKELCASNLQILQSEISEKRKLLSYIETEAEPRLQDTKGDLQDAWDHRGELLKQLIDCRALIHRARSEQVSLLTEKLKGAVRIELEASENRAEYLAYLRKIFTGSHIIHVENQLGLVVDNLLPHELSEYILEKDETGLASATGVTSNTASKLVHYPQTEAVLELQTISVTDSPKISLRRAGEENYTPLDRLSYGERCTAILSIALLNKKKPLIIDQPEDELDHEFITDDIVAGIKDIKGSRQIIIASHDPNIPVLGDAELIIRLSKQPGEDRCMILAQGALEDKRVLPHVIALDGGKEAFERRRRKYMLT